MTRQIVTWRADEGRVSVVKAQHVIQDPIESLNNKPKKVEKTVGKVKKQHKQPIRKVEDVLAEIVTLRKQELSPEEEHRLRKAEADLQLEYLHQVSPRAAEVYEARRRDDIARGIRAA